jgi:hypothetical protein
VIGKELFCFPISFLYVSRRPLTPRNDSRNRMASSMSRLLNRKVCSSKYRNKMERSHKDVRAVDRPFQMAPEVLHPIRMNMAFDVLYGVVNDLVNGVDPLAETAS